MYKHLSIAAVLAFTLTTSTQAQQTPKADPTLRSILLEQFQNTWNKEDWFVPVSIAVEGITAKQAMWKPNDSSHSVGELAYHIWFWNKEQLDKFNGRKTANVNDNKETFTAFTEATWTTTIQQLNQVMSEWETAIRTADETKLKKWYSAIDHINTHTAYHTGQILYIRKLAGNWDANKGVK